MSLSLKRQQLSLRILLLWQLLVATWLGHVLSLFDSRILVVWQLQTTWALLTQISILDVKCEFRACPTLDTWKCWIESIMWWQVNKVYQLLTHPLPFGIWHHRKHHLVSNFTVDVDVFICSIECLVRFCLLREFCLKPFSVSEKNSFFSFCESFSRRFFSFFQAILKLFLSDPSPIIGNACQWLTN